MLTRRFIASLALSLLFFQAAPAGAAGRDALLTIGAAPLGGTYYPAAIAIADLIKKHAPGLEARVEVTGGTMENPVLMEQDELQLGLANTDVAYFAASGKPPFKTPLVKPRGLFTGLAPGVVQYAVRGDSSIRSIADLKGKRVAVGPQGNSSGLLFLKVLRFHNVNPSELSFSYISFSDGVNELLDGHVDMAIVQAGLPAPGLQEAFAGPRPVRILSFPEKERDAFLREHPYYLPVTIPKETYANMDSAVTTFATSNMVLVHRDMPADQVYAVTRAVFEHLPELHAAHPSLRSVVLESAARTPIPLHEGAKRYFAEKNVLPPSAP